MQLGGYLGAQESAAHEQRLGEIRHGNHSGYARTGRHRPGDSTGGADEPRKGRARWAERTDSAGRATLETVRRQRADGTARGTLLLVVEGTFKSRKESSRPPYSG